MVHTPNCLKLRTVARRKIMEAVACVMKYFDAASVDRGWCLEIIRGMTAKRFISSPTHMRNRLLLDIVIMGPKKIVK